ncbi:MAG: hypothetical protein ACLU3I_05835 [Acutalibacteraceae bacterium]
MKALVYTTQAKMDGRKVIEPGKCELLDIPEPQLLPTDDMKIRVDYCAMCATDVHIVTMGLYGMPAPWIMGMSSAARSSKSIPAPRKTALPSATRSS